MVDRPRCLRPGRPAFAGWPGWLLAFLVVCLAACSPNDTPLRLFSGPTMGTQYRVKLYLPTAGQTVPDDAAIQAAIQEELALVNRLMSTYQPDSELSRFNQAPLQQPFTFSEPTLHVLAVAQTVWRETEGAFDATVGPLVDLWGFGPAQRDSKPSEQDVSKRLAQLGMDAIQVTADGVVKHKPVHLDLSGVAKGYATDRVAERLEAMGIQRYMVEVGGELRVGESKPEGQPWWIAIEQPVEGQMGFAQLTLPLTKMSVATSGDYRNFYVEDGRRFSHIIDPTTGFPVQHQVASVTVLHPSNAVADAYATAFMVLPVQKTLAVAERLGLPVYVLERGAEGVFETHASSAFAAFHPQ